MFRSLNELELLHLHYCFQSNLYSCCYHCVVVIVVVAVVAAVTYFAVANYGCCCCCCYVQNFKKEMRGGEHVASISSVYLSVRPKIFK